MANLRPAGGRTPVRAGTPSTGSHAKPTLVMRASRLVDQQRQHVRERGWTTEKFINWSVLLVERMFLDPMSRS
jgi:hypothetical protein